MNCRQIFYFIFPILFIGCSETDDPNPPLEVDFEAKVVGKWIQHETYQLDGSTIVPDQYFWFPVDNGDIIEFFDNGEFEYSKYEECHTGTYEVLTGTKMIEFYLDCEIDLYGEMTDFMEKEYSPLPEAQNFFFLAAPLDDNVEFCTVECINLFRRLADEDD